MSSFSTVRARFHRWCNGRLGGHRALAALLGLLLSLALSGNVHAQDVAEVARQWAEASGFSGSMRLTRGDELLAKVDRGHFDRSGAPIADDTAFWIGSISKQFAAVATLRLAEQQRLELQAPIARYFPELEPGALSKGGVPCSVEHVLSHTCGLSRDLRLFDPLYAAGMMTDPARAQRLLSDLNGAELKFAPGTDQLYSNVGYALIGLLVQRAAGMPYEQYLQQSFWGPLGMRHTGIQPRPDVAIARGQLALGFASLDAASWGWFDPNYPAELGAAGNMFSTTSDLLRWTHALHRGQLLRPESYQSLITPRREDYGLGTATSQKPFGTVLWHNGAHAPHSSSSLVLYVPERELALAALSNHDVRLSNLFGFADAVLAAASHTPSARLAHPPPAAQRLLAASTVLMLSAVRIILVVSLCWYCLRRAKYTRWGWWLRYHGTSLALLMALFLWRAPAALDPLLLVGCGLALVVAVRQRWWTLPLLPADKRGRAYADLATQVAVAAALAWFVPARMVLSFALACVLPGLTIAWLQRKSSLAPSPPLDAPSSAQV